MQEVILVIHLIVAVALVIIILLQPSEAGGFMGTGSMSNLMAPRRSVDAMTRTTTILAGIFFLTSMFLAIVASRQPAARSILDVDADAPKIENKVNDKSGAAKEEPKPASAAPAAPKAPVAK